ncbi:MAG: glycosyltransferase involved in cell wall biosynthesis [Planctomycetota bacterium]
MVSNRWDLVGGSERYAGEVVNGLLARGIETSVLCARGKRDTQVHVRTMPGLDAGRLDSTTRRELRELLRDIDRVLLISHATADVLRELLRGAPLVRFVQDHTLFCPGQNKQHENGDLCNQSLGVECLSRYYLRGGCSGMKIQGSPALRRPVRALSNRLQEIELTRRASAVVVASEYMRGELRRSGMNGEAIEVLPYFTNSVQIPTMPTLPSSGNFKTTVFTPARLALPDKGIDYLLTALGRTRASVRLVIAGDGPARSWLEEKARAEGLVDRVTFTGWLSPKEIEAHYARCDMVCCPSVWNEPFGLVGIEAMAHGKPVIAFDCGGIPEWLEDGVTGILCPRKDTEAMASAMNQLTLDEQERARMGQAGLERVEREFRPKRHLDRLHSILSR